MINFAIAETLKEEPRVPACSGMDPGFFVGFDGSGETRIERESREDRAKLMCRNCPLIAECLDWALSNDEKGVWGGTNVEDRRVIKRRRARGSHPGTDPLTKKQRERVEREEEAWRLYVIGSNTVPEIADRLGVATDTAYTYIRRQKKVRDAETDSEASATTTPSVRGARYSDPIGKKIAVLTTTSGLV